jgi:alkyl sulfatase BDS1-like metallo-beta-lactamase superfamily hydrolase
MAAQAAVRRPCRLRRCQARARGALPEPTIKSADGKTADFSAYASNRRRTPRPRSTELWRLAQLNNEAGLFKVADRVYQVRGADLANMNIIEGDTGLIIIDTLLTAETARRA